MPSNPILSTYLLNISVTLYLIRYIPQLLHNHLRKKTHHISLWSHTILLIGYLADTGYGIACAMPWQYRLVSCSGLAMLLIQHGQLGHQCWQQYRLNVSFNTKRWRVYIGCTLLILLLSMTLALPQLFGYKKIFHHFNIGLGYIALIAWLTYQPLQIRFNRNQKTTDGFHSSFIIIGLGIGLCDLACGLLLSWPLPSILSALWSLTTHLVWLAQWLHYRPTHINQPNPSLDLL